MVMGWLTALARILGHVILSVALLAGAGLCALGALEAVVAVVRPAGDALTPEPSPAQAAPPEPAVQAVAEKQPVAQTAAAPTARPAPQAVACNSNYYAVLATAGAPACAPNPTAQMPHWGPPSDAWFVREAGQFRIDPAHVLDAPVCACLQRQPGYRRAQGSFFAPPVSQAVVGEQSVAIEKWVCGDPCLREVN